VPKFRGLKCVFMFLGVVLVLRLCLLHRILGVFFGFVWSCFGVLGVRGCMGLMV
jgi:hypothetical protein